MFEWIRKGWAVAFLWLGMSASGQTPVELALSLQDSSWKYLFSNEERALEFVNKALELEGQIPDTIIANSYNHLAIHHGLHYELEPAKAHFQTAFSLMRGAPKRQAIIARNLGMILKDLKDFEAAESKFLAALALHDSLGDSHQLAMDHCAIGSLRIVEGRVVEAISRYNTGLDLFNLENERERISYWVEQINLGFIYIDSGQYDFAATLFKSSADGLEAVGRLAQSVQARVNLINALLYQHKVLEAQSEIDHIAGLDWAPSPTLNVHQARLLNLSGDHDGALNILNRQDPDELEAFDNTGYYFCEKITALVGLDRWEDALKLAVHVRERHPQGYHDIGSEFESVATWEARIRGQMADATDVEMRTAHQLDTLIHLALTRLDNRAGILKGRFETDYMRLEQAALAEHNAFLSALNEKSRSQNSLLAGAVVLLSLGLVLLVVVGRLQQRLSAQAESAARAAAELAANQAELAQLRSQRLEESMRIKQSELVVSAVEMARLKNLVESTLGDLDKSQINHPTIESLRRQIHHGHFFEQFKQRFQRIHPDFDAEMLKRYPDLTPNDLEFCQLLKLGLSSREISEVLNISSSSFMTRKYRLRKRMGLVEGDRIETHLA